MKFISQFARRLIFGLACLAIMVARAAQPLDPALLTKTIEITSLTNTAKSLSVQCHTPLLPGEVITARIKYPDGRIEEGLTSYMCMQSSGKASYTTFFHWTLPDSFGTAEIQTAVAQVLNLKTEGSVLQRLVDKTFGNTPTPPTNASAKLSRVLELTHMRPLALFTVTNSSGGVLAGLLSFERTLPRSGSKNAALISFRRGIGSSLMAFYTATVPPGYSLEATVDGPGMCQAHTSHSISRSMNDYTSSWFIMDSDRASSKSGGEQLARLVNEGSIAVRPGEPYQVFAYTNSGGAKVRGFFELKGPVGAKPDAAMAGNNATLVRAMPESMRALARRICEGNAEAGEELRKIAAELYRDIDFEQEQDRVRSNLGLMRAAFDELGAETGRGGTNAMGALKMALGATELRAFVPNALGIAAANGNGEALEMLLSPAKWNMLLSSVVFALQPVAEKNNESAVSFLVEILGNPRHRPLWAAASQGLAGPAADGNAKAKAALEKYVRESGK